MNHLNGITKLQIAIFTNADDVNHFLRLHDGNIIDIQNGTRDILIIYRDIENE